MEQKPTIFKRVYIVYGFILVMSVAIIARILQIQLVQGEMWKERAVKQSLRYFNIEPNRGDIYDVNGQVLATSIPLFEVRMDVASPNIPDSVFNNNVDSLAICLANYFKDKSKQEYKRMLVEARADKNRYLLLKRKADYEQLKTLRTFPIFRLGRNAGGLITDVQYKRLYPYDYLAYRTLGWYKEESPNSVGIESSFNPQLQGSVGKRLYQRIPNDYWRPLSNENEVEPENGSDIITTIDINLQDVAEEALMRQLEFNKADHGCAIVMQVSTGEIRAIANLGRNKNGQYEELYNYAIGESTEPGSTFKLFSLLAAFHDGKANLTDMVNTTGGITQYANRTMKDSHLGGGVMTVQQTFEKSSNVGVSKVIYRAYASHPQAFIDRLYSFGVDKKIGLDIAGEGYPQVFGTKSKFWSNTSLPWKSIGYEVALTPLQILNFYNAVANNGVMVKPHLIKEIRQAGIAVKSYPTVVTNPKIASDKAIKMAHVMLEGVVEHGTGSALKNPVYKIAGKTGTAQVAQRSGGYNKSDYKGSFVGYFPADKPMYSCIVVINNPSEGGYYGGAIAAPVFHEIADRIYSTDPQVNISWADLGKPTVINPIKAGNLDDIRYLDKWLGVNNPQTAVGEWMTYSSDSTGKKYVSVMREKDVVPSVLGMGARDAVYLLEKLGLKVKISGLGMVKQQSITPGSKFNRGNIIQLQLGI